MELQPLMLMGQQELATVVGIGVDDEDPGCAATGEHLQQLLLDVVELVGVDDPLVGLGIELGGEEALLGAELGREEGIACHCVTLLSSAV